MVREMQAMFGKTMWEYTIIGVSHWAYDEQSIKQRNATGKDEEWYMAEQNRELEEKFHINRTIPGVFIDSFSQQVWNIDDQTQQDAFQRETEKLWVFAKSKDLFEFKTVEDIMEENQALTEENLRLHDIIDEEIENLKDDMSALASSVAINSNNIDNNSDEISLVSTTLTESINGVSQQVDGNKAAIDKMEIELSELPEVPIGTILSWVVKVDKNGGEIASLPDGWLRCDGSTIPAGSIWTGKPLPDLNGEKRFLRGGSDDDVLTMEEAQMESHEHSESATAHVSDP